MRQRIAVALALGALAVLILVLALGFRRDPTAIRSAIAGGPAPCFDLPTLDGGRFSLADELAAGHPVVANFWATWCVECKREHPMMVAVWERYRTSEVRMVGIVFQDDPDAAREYLRT